MITRMGGGDRLIVLSSPQVDEHPESLSRFAGRLKDSLKGYHSSLAVTDGPAKKWGFVGRELHFDMMNETEGFDCELFVFALEGTGWGVLHARSKTAAPASGSSAFDRLRKTTSVPADVVGAEPFRVKEEPLASFAISFEVIRNRGADRVQEIVITDVPQDSAAERYGVKPGDKIIRIDGRKTEDFAVGVGKNSELGRVFLNRIPGDEVKLELAAVGTSPTPRVVTLRVPSLRTWLRLDAAVRKEPAD